MFYSRLLKYNLYICININAKKKKMENVTLTLKDELNGIEVERTISAINAMKNGSVCWEKGNEEDQREALERWISERGNEQHDTMLSLISWKFEK